MRTRYLKIKYANLPLFTRPFMYFLFRFIVKGGFLDGKKGLIWHFLQGFWYRFLVDAKIYEVYQRAGKEKNDIISHFRQNMEKTSRAQTSLSSYNNSWYKPGNIFKQVAWYIIGRITINTYLPIPMFFKILVLRVFGAKIGSNVTIKPKVNIKYPWFFIAESDIWIGENVWIDNLTTVTLCNNCCLSQGAMLLTGNHNFTSQALI